MKTSKNTSRASHLQGAALLTLLLASFTTPLSAEWFVEAGPFYRGQMKLSVNGGSRARDTGALAAVPGTRGGTTIGPGLPVNDDGTAAVFRAFDNGYVGPSGWGWAQDAGLTQYFAYETADQYDAAANTLTFTRSVSASGEASTRTATRVTESGQPGWRDATRTNGVGIIATLGYLLCERTDPEDAERGEEKNDHEWSLLFRFGWLNGMGANFRSRSALRQNVNTTRETSMLTGADVRQYSYDTLGNPFFPSAPYTMANPGGVGPLIADTPETITPLSTFDTTTGGTGRTAYQAQSLVDLDLDVEAFTFQFGPRWLWGLNDSVSLFLQPLATVNLIDVTARRQEHFRDSNGRLIGSWNDRADEQSWRWGGGIQLGLQAYVSENWYLNGSGGYDWVKAAHVNVGPDRVRIDLSGYQIELALGRRF
ncbi:MAG: hypothetical protein JJU05_16070 [Verrucomicrobia bacterium]|nr:hypothetical protein [Verrucomicrobiota bacterium]MCH8528891.1 hypothetical protein [Kiritimatiellia bacterium]